jgi:transposase
MGEHRAAAPRKWSAWRAVARPPHRHQWLKQWRGLATRYEKRAANYWAMLVLAAIFIWLDS